MKLIARLTLRALKENRRRTMATMLAIIIATAMLCSITTLAASAINGMKQREIDTSGYWHTEYAGVPGDQVSRICEDEGSAACAVTQGVGYARSEKIYNVRRPYFYITAVDADGFAFRPYPLLKGRLPKTSQEVLLPESLASLSSFSAQIGDTLTLTMGKRVRDDGTTMAQNYSYEGEDERFVTNGRASFTIVGIYDDSASSNSLSAGYDFVSGMTQISDAQTYDVYVQNTPLDSSLYAHADALGSETGCEEVVHNSYLLLYEGVAGDDQLVFMIKLLTLIISLIITVSAMAVIYNSFNISLSQRSRYLGMLASVGATRAQKRQSVFLEALFLAIPCIPLGIAAGLGATALTLNHVSAVLSSIIPGMQMPFVISPALLALAVLLSLITLFVSACRPAQRAASITPIKAIRQTKDINASHVRFSQLIQKVFGFEAVLALKNQKRSRGRYLAVLFSLTLSLTLFITVSTFTSYLQRASSMTLETVPDVMLTYSTGSVPDDIHKSDPLLTLDHAQEAVRIQSIYLSLRDSSLINDDIQQLQREQYGDVASSMRIASLDDASLQRLCEQNGIARQAVLEQGGGILANHITSEISQADHTFAEADYLKPGITELTLDSMGDETVSHTLPIAAYISSTDVLDMENSDIGGATIYVSEDTLERLSEGTDRYYQYVINYSTDDAQALESEIEQCVNQNADLQMYADWQSAEEGQAQQDTMYSVINLFVYAFILLIACICVTNVFNTLTSSLALRASENATLLSIGMTRKQFRRMISFEALFYAIKSSIYGILLALPLCLLIYNTIGVKFSFEFYLPLAHVLIGVFILILLTVIIMRYHMSLNKKESMIETIRRESI